MVFVENEVEVAQEAVRVNCSRTLKVTRGGPQRFGGQRSVIKMDAAAASEAPDESRTAHVDRAAVSNAQHACAVEADIQVAADCPAGTGAFDGPLAPCSVVIAKIAVSRGNRYATCNAEGCFTPKAGPQRASLARVEIHQDILIGLAIDRELPLEAVILIEEQVDIVCHQAVRVDCAGALEIAEAGQQPAGGERAVVEMNRSIACAGAAHERVLRHFCLPTVNV
jgi:hypothetical protein